MSSLEDIQKKMNFTLYSIKSRTKGAEYVFYKHYVLHNKIYITTRILRAEKIISNYTDILNLTFYSVVAFKLPPKKSLNLSILFSLAKGMHFLFAICIFVMNTKGTKISCVRPVYV